MVSYQRYNRRGLMSTGTIIYICHSFLGQETLVLLHETASELTFALFLRSSGFVINASTGYPNRMLWCIYILIALLLLKITDSKMLKDWLYLQLWTKLQSRQRVCQTWPRFGHIELQVVILCDVTAHFCVCQSEIYNTDGTGTHMENMVDFKAKPLEMIPWLRMQLRIDFWYLLLVISSRKMKKWDSTWFTSLHKTMSAQNQHHESS